MIGNMVPRKLVAISALVGVVCSGMPPLLAARLERPASISEPSGILVELLDRQGEVIGPDKLRLQGEPPQASSVPAKPVDIELVRNLLRSLQKSADSKIARRADQLQLWFDIATAKTPSERHAAIRRLPVTVVASAATDGGAGTVKSYIARGTPRLRVTIPARHTLTSPASAAEDPPTGTGPSVSESLPHKACYQEEPEPCVTWEEMEDLFIVIAEAEAETDQQEAEYAAAQAELEAFCNQNPWACEEEPLSDEELLSITSGPSVCPNAPACAAETLAATGAVLGAVASWVGAYALVSGAAAASVTVAALAATGAVSLMAGSILGSAAAILFYVECKRRTIVQLP